MAKIAGEGTEREALRPQEPGEAPGEDLDTVHLTGEAEELVGQVVADADAFRVKVDQDLAAGIDAGANEAKAELTAVKKDARRLGQDFLKGLSRILHVPVRALRNFQERRIQKQLLVEDNPKVIKRLKKLLADQNTPVTECISLYKKAAQRQDWPWREIRKALDTRIIDEIPKSIAQGKTDAALALWDELSAVARTDTFADQITDLMYKPLLAALPQAGSSFTADNFLRRLDGFESLNHDMESRVHSHDRLPEAHRYSIEKAERKLFSNTERFLKNQSRAAIMAMTVFTSGQQEAIAQSWQTHRDIAWADVLTDAEAPKIAETILSLPAINEYQVKGDRQTILTIEHDFPVNDRAAIWDKAGNPEDCNCDQTYTYLVIARLPQSTTEQIKSLTKVQLSYVTLALFAYGESKVAELWTDDNVLDLQEYSQGYRYGRSNPEAYIDFAKNITPALQEHLPTSSGSGSGFHSASRTDRIILDYEGFQGIPEQIQKFKNAIKCIPEAQREAFFTMLKPSPDYYRASEWSHLTVAQVNNFIEYAGLTQSAKTVPLYCVIGQREYFSDEHWPKVRQGIETCGQLALSVPAISEDEEDLKMNLRIYERAGMPEHATANQFWKTCQTRSDSYVGQASYSTSYELKPRSLNSIDAMYDFFDICRQYFSVDHELVAERLHLSDNERRIIQLWSEGALVSTADSAVDIACMEGIVNHLSYLSASRMSAEESATLERFSKLNAKQKEHWLYFKEHISWSYDERKRNDDLFDLASDDVRCAEIESFHKQTGLTGFSLEATRTMIARQDCVGLFYYLSGANINIEFENQQRSVDKLIALHDAGLPAAYSLSAFPEASDVPAFVKSLLSWDNEKLAECGRIAVSSYPELTLNQIMQLNPAGTSDGLRREIEYAAVMRSAHLYSREASPEQPEIDKLRERTNRIRELCNIDCDSNQTYSLRYLSEPAWKKLSSNSEVLGLFITSKSRSFPDAGIDFPDDVLTNPMLWRYSFPNSFWQNAQTMRTAFGLMEKCEMYEVPLARAASYHSEKWEEWLQAYQEKPWLFTASSLEFISKEELYLLPNFAALSEQEWSQAMPALAQYSYRMGSEVDECIQHWREGSPLLAASTMDTLHGYVNVIPWSEAKIIAASIANGEDLADIVAQRDAAETYPHQWKDARIACYQKKIKDVLPTFTQHSEFTIAQWEQFSRLPRETLHNLELLSSCARDILPYHKEGLGDFIAIASHENFETVCSLLNLNKFSYNLLWQPVETLRVFCDRLTAGIVDHFRTWPENIIIAPVDAIDFFAYSQAENIIAFANELRKIFGNEFRMSVYDLLIMDTNTDFENIKKLQAECALPVTPDYLRMLAAAATSEVQATIAKLLAMFDTSYKIDFNIATAKLTELPLELRASVLIQKGPGNFGWSILPHRAALLSSLQCTAEQVDQLICGVYRSNYESMPEIDLPVARALLLESGTDNVERTKRLVNIFNRYQDEPQSLVSLVLANHEALITIVSTLWSAVPDYFKKEQDFWEVVRDQVPAVFLDHYNERVSAVALTDNVVEHAISAGSVTHLNLLLDINDYVLTPEQIKNIIVAYIERGEPDSWLKDPRKKILLQDQFAAYASGWELSGLEQSEMLQQLERAGVINSAAGHSVQAFTPQAESKLLIAMVQIQGGSLNNLNHDLDIAFGEQINRLSTKSDFKYTDLVRGFAKQEFASLNNAAELEINEQNWLPLVMAFVRADVEDHELPQLEQGLTKRAKDLFQSSEAKDFCYKKLEQLWQEYSHSEQPEQMSCRLAILTEFVNDCGGAGPMSQFEALSLFIHSAREALTKPSTVDRTKGELIHGLSTMDQRFTRERWSNEDKTGFYQISRDVITAAPSLATEFLGVFQKLSPSALRRFHKELYPLYCANLAVVGQSTGEAGTVKYQARDLVAMRQGIRHFASADEINDGIFDNSKKQLIAGISERFKTRFGIKKIPEQFTPEHVRSLTNMTLYLANLHGHNQKHEQLIGWYLALMINDQWEAFRRGEKLDPYDYLEERQATDVAAVLKRQQELNPLTAKHLNVAEDNLDEFQKLLQIETANIAIGDVETIDVKLGNVIINIRSLEDPDLYPDILDKDRLSLLLEHGNKKVGAAAAKLYQSLRDSGRPISVSDSEAAIQGQMKAISDKHGLPFTAETIKTCFQDGMKQLAIAVNVLHYVEETHATDEIAYLRELLQPSDEVVAIFTRLGEEFKPTSGAMALAQDLDYLDNIIIKRGNELQPEERALLVNYVGDVRTQVIKLQETYDKIKTKFTEMRRNYAQTPNVALHERLGQIDQIINTQATQQSVTSTATGDPNSIIENIRACLSCKNAGCNNDTNLAFGDSNKFFIYSHTETQRKGSVADEIVFLEPVTHPDGRQEMAFVLDRIYGSCTPFILTNHIMAIVKKYRAIKQRFPECTLSVIVSNEAVSTGGLSADLLNQRMAEQFGSSLSIESGNIEVDVIESAMADHYIEFGDKEARTAGKRSVSGMIIRS